VVEVEVEVVEEKESDVSNGESQLHAAAHWLRIGLFVQRKGHDCGSLMLIGRRTRQVPCPSLHRFAATVSGSAL
jgi:hypothetical protein